MQFDLFKSKEQITKEEGKVCKKCNVYLPLTAYAWRGNEGFQRTECKDCLREIVAVLKGLHRITPTASTDHVCPICNKNAEDVKLNRQSAKGKKRVVWVLDHDHIKQEFRGWLCDRCNRGLGAFDDNLEHLENAIKYLKEK